MVVASELELIVKDEVSKTGYELSEFLNKLLKSRKIEMYWPEIPENEVIHEDEDYVITKSHKKAVLEKIKKVGDNFLIHSYNGFLRDIETDSVYTMHLHTWGIDLKKLDMTFKSVNPTELFELVTEGDSSRFGDFPNAKPMATFETKSSKIGGQVYNNLEIKGERDSFFNKLLEYVRS